MHLVLAIFWLILGVLGQVFWDTIQPHAFIPVGRGVFGFIFFLLFCYNFVRWRMERLMRRRQQEVSPPPPRPRVVDEYNPTFDFNKTDSDDKKPTT